MQQKEKEEIVQFGLCRLKVNLISILITIILGYIMGMFIESIFFLISFFPLRCYAGGYHAKTQMNCFIISFSIIGICFAFFKNINIINYGVIMFLDIACSFVIWKLAPVDNLNKRLDIKSLEKYKIYTRRNLVVENLILVFLYKTTMSCIFKGISISIFITAFAMVLGYMENQKTIK